MRSVQSGRQIGGTDSWTRYTRIWSFVLGVRAHLLVGGQLGRRQISRNLEVEQVFLEAWAWKAAGFLEVWAWKDYGCEERACAWKSALKRRS